ncbi:hypothetical protein [Bacillus marinisedimentorum]|uniref:hypothetical protein n=1 Tax=Bacillus marinisedimentorum TaxID=1821260 RepID=UPI0007DF38F9|nr:hypothetical protein [Bacillus marinisedimentorum]
MNVFEFVCFILAAGAFIKVFFGVFFHKKFYSWVRREYAREQRPWTVNALAGYGLFVLALTWLGVFFDYAQYGWVLAPLLTAASMKTLLLLFDWEKTSRKFVSFIDTAGSRGLWGLDLFVLVIGTAFLWAGLYLF